MLYIWYLNYFPSKFYTRNPLHDGSWKQEWRWNQIILSGSLWSFYKGKKFWCNSLILILSSRRQYQESHQPDASTSHLFDCAHFLSNCYSNRQQRVMYRSSKLFDSISPTHVVLYTNALSDGCQWETHGLLKRSYFDIVASNESIL